MLVYFLVAGFVKFARPLLKSSWFNITRGLLNVCVVSLRVQFLHIVSQNKIINPVEGAISTRPYAFTQKRTTHMPLTSRFSQYTLVMMNLGTLGISYPVAWRKIRLNSLASRPFVATLSVFRSNREGFCTVHDPGPSIVFKRARLKLGTYIKDMSAESTNVIQSLWYEELSSGLLGCGKMCFTVSWSFDSDGIQYWIDALVNLPAIELLKFSMQKPIRTILV